MIDSGDEGFLASHRREIVVVFCDLRGFTAFAESSEPEEVMAVLAEYHAALGELINRFEGTLERFNGDGLMVFFNDPLPCDDPAERAVAMAVAMRDRVAELAAGWSRRATTSASASASPRATPRSAGSGSRAIGPRGDRQRHEPGRTALRRRRPRADPRRAARLHGR